MSLNVTAEDKICKGLVCAYTKKPITVRVVAAGSGSPIFFSPDAFDPSVPVASSTELFKMLSTRNGIIGAATGGEEFKCPYTGKTITVRRTANGMHYAHGGLSPNTPTFDKVALVRGLMMRNGKVPEGAPAAKDRVVMKKIIPEEKRPDLSPSVSREAEAYVEGHADLLVRGVKRPATVGVPDGVPKKAPAKRKRRKPADKNATPAS